MGPLLFGLVTLTAAAQVAGTAIVGTVIDGHNGDPVAGAVVALTDLQRTAITDDRGRYTIRDVPPGPQHVRVTRIGYAPRTLHALVPPSGELAIDIVLRPAPLRLRTVDVRPPVAIRGVDEVEPPGVTERSVSAAAVRNHPLLSEPDIFLATTGGEVVVSPESPSGVHIRGGSSDQTGFLLDGFPVLNPYHAAGTFSAWNPDAIERVVVSPAASVFADADALSGTVAAETRAPGARVGMRGGISTTQARLTVDGPLGLADGGFLLGIRSGFAGFIVPQREPSYLGGRTGDALLKLEFAPPVGRLRLLAYASDDAFDASASAWDSVSTHADWPRHTFEWSSSTLGAEWTGRVGDVAVRVRGWTASSDAAAMWNTSDTTAMRLRADRQDDGVHAAIERRARTITIAGVRARRSRTAYRVTGPDLLNGPVAIVARTPATTVFGMHERPLGRRIIGKAAISLAAADGRVYSSPHAELQWVVSPALTMSGAYTHARQFAQSLRNPETIIAGVYPADLYVGAAASEVPVARSDDGALAARYRPAAGVQIGAQIYARTMGGLVLVAPRSGEPFATGEIAVGGGPVLGVAVDASVSGARYGVIASYGWQRVRRRYGDSSYVPDHAATHLAEAGGILFLGTTASIRLGMTGAAGRRGTPLAGPFEWEACNLLDRGCELAGRPRTTPAALGRTRLPPYLRVDVGGRKHWHVRFGSRDALVAVFGTVTNVIGRTNVLTFATNPTTGEPTPVAMRPLAPLVVGVDWRF